MNKEILKYLEEKEGLRVRSIAQLSINTGKSFREAEKELDAMFREGQHPTAIQAEFEKAMSIC